MTTPHDLAVLVERGRRAYESTQRVEAVTRALVAASQRRLEQSRHALAEAPREGAPTSA